MFKLQRLNNGTSLQAALVQATAAITVQLHPLSMLQVLPAD
jgi:hypothetical protein